MALSKQGVKVNFTKGINQKLDPWQLPADNFQTLNNSVFNKVGLAEKRNGYAQLGMLTSASYNQISTLNGNLIVSGENIASYSQSLETYQTEGSQLTSTLSVLPLVRNVYNVNSGSEIGFADSVVSNGLVCTVWGLNVASEMSYQINDAITGNAVVPLTVIGTTQSAPRVFVLGNYFLITFITTVGGQYHLQYIAIPTNNPTSPGSATNIATNLNAAATCYDGIVSSFSGSLFLGYIVVSTGAYTILNINTSLTISSPANISGVTCSVLATAVVTDNNNHIWYLFTQQTMSVNYLYVACYSESQVLVLGATSVGSTFRNPANLTGFATPSNSTLTLYHQISHYGNYSSNTIYPNWLNGGTGSTSTGTAGLSDYILTATVTPGGTVTNNGVFQRGVGLWSKAFVYNNVGYVLVSYGQSNVLNLQPSYFLLDQNDTIIAKLAYGNGAGYNSGLCNVTVYGNNAYLAYQIAFNTQAQNKFSISDPTGIFSQLGVNLVNFSLNSTTGIAEAAGSLHVGGTIVNQYDQLELVEHQFCVWPDDVCVVVNSSGSLASQTYQYQCIYQWIDNQGFVHRSAPSTIAQILLNGSQSADIYVPTLRLTAKTNVQIVVYRWSVAQPIFYQTLSSDYFANDKTIDYLYINDVNTDAEILGNEILYTNGGVVDDIQAPACFDPVLYHDRLWITTAENTSSLWYSKQIIPSTPVEFSDQFTYFVSPTKLGIGGVYCKAVMDDRLIFFKSGSISYITGYGPDNTGANNDLSEPTEIVSPVGCINRNSVVTIPTGIFFQASNSGGIWLLDRSLQVSYIGAPVSLYNSANVLSALLIPGTNQIRIHLDNNIILMYDYFVGQWGTFSNEEVDFGTSSVIYNGLHTYLDTTRQIQQETPGVYLDGSQPVLMNFTTAWFAMAGLQGYQRCFAVYILANYLSAHNLQIQIAYDYNSTSTQTTTINPNGSNLVPTDGNPEQWRVFFSKQRCQSFQLTIQEVYTGTPGAALTISGLNILAAFKSAWRTISAAKSVGS